MAYPALPSLDRRALLGVAGAALLGTGARAQGTAKPPPAPKGQVIVGLSQEPTRFNPLMPAIEVDQGVWWNLFSPLWNVLPDGTFSAVLAKEVPSLANGGISADGLNWRVRLRDDVKWHDGKPFTAEDVKFTIELVTNPKFRAGSRAGHDMVRDLTVVGPHELTWKMSAANAVYISRLAWTFMVPKHILGAVADPNDAPFNNAPVGTGPFMWGERVAGDHVLLRANPHYFGDGPYLERLVFKYIPDMTVMYTQFRTGEIDYTSIQGITPDRYAEARKLPGRIISVNPSASIESITPNLEMPQVSELAVRQALYYGMNKKAIIDAIYYGLPTPAESFLPKQSWAYDAGLPKQEYSPAKANQILDAAGWVRGSDGIRSKGGVRLAFTNSTTAGNQVREQAQQLLVQDWKAIGAAMSIKNMPAAVIWGDYFRLSKFDTVMVGVTFGIGPDPDVTDRFASTAIPAKGGSGRNTTQFANAKVDKLLREGIAEFDLAKRKAIYVAIQQEVRNDLAILPMFQYATIEGVKQGLVGYKPNINALSNCWNCGSWSWAS
ncbi:MAG: peptide ABC transporter substrate-binding protein [Acetobacteraceae bacterium]|nr:peptide ABC transporter substrate-binding protein [Acetobacteraceae bacterium]